MKRREFITLLGGAAAAWPLAARAQQPERLRRVGVLMNIAADDADAPVRVAAFAQGLQELGWIIGRNCGSSTVGAQAKPTAFADTRRKWSALAPEVIWLLAVRMRPPLQQATGNVPIVFLGVTDPVGAGFVASLARPGGNVTGFTAVEFGISVKWLELLKQIAPALRAWRSFGYGEYRRGRPIGRNSGRGGVTSGWT